MTSYTLERLSDILGISKDAVKKRAARESWPYEEETCRGGKRRLYRIESLPKDVKRKVDLWVADIYARNGERLMKEGESNVFGHHAQGKADGAHRKNGLRQSVQTNQVEAANKRGVDAEIPELAGGSTGNCASKVSGRSSAEIQQPRRADLERRMTESATPAAHGGESIHAGVPSPADTSPAATAAGGLTGVGAIAHVSCNSSEVAPAGAALPASAGVFGWSCHGRRDCGVGDGKSHGR